MSESFGDRMSANTERPDVTLLPLGLFEDRGPLNGKLASVSNLHTPVFLFQAFSV